MKTRTHYYYRLKLITLEFREGRKVWVETLCDARFTSPEGCLADAEPYIAGRDDVQYAYPVLCQELIS